MNEDKKVLWSTEINSFEADQNSNIKMVSLQNLLQEMAYRGSGFCGCGQDVMNSKGVFWALNRIHFSILRCPRWGDKVKLQTWSRGQMGPLWHRNFRIEDSTGNPMVLGTSAWTVICRSPSLTTAPLPSSSVSGSASGVRPTSPSTWSPSSK